MTDDHATERPADQPGTGHNETGPVSRPAPDLMPGVRPGPVGEPPEGSDGGNAADARAASLTARVQEILREVDAIREQTGDEFSLESLAEQTAKLEQAHEVLTAALADIDRR